MNTVGFLKFKRRAGGDGAVLSETWLSYDASRSPTYSVPGVVTIQVEPGLERTIAECLIAAALPVDTAGAAAARANILARLSSLRSALLLRPFQVIAHPRGYLSIPNVHDNFGDLVAVAPDNSETVLAAKCVPERLEVVDDIGLYAIKIAIAFLRVTAASVP
jgi:hypothetical protein